MFRSFFSRLLFLVLLAGFFLVNQVKAQTQTIRSGSFIVNMGIVP
jgi:hypothetical protein